MKLAEISHKFEEKLADRQELEEREENGKPVIAGHHHFSCGKR